MRRLALVAALGAAAMLTAAAFPAATQTPPPEAAGPVAAGSVEDELGRSLAAVLLGQDTAARNAFAVARTGPRFAQMLGGPEAVAKAYADMAATFSGAVLRDVLAGPGGSVMLVFAGADGAEIKLHVVRGVTMPDGKLKVGGFALVP